MERKVVLASHGEFSKGLKDSLKMILGEAADEVRAYSLYPGENAVDFKEELEKEIRQSENMEYVILTDVFGGSVCNALLPLTIYDNVKLFSGMNFNMAAEILMHGEAPLEAGGIEEILDTARNGICHLVLEEQEKEDF